MFDPSSVERGMPANLLVSLKAQPGRPEEAIPTGDTCYPLWRRLNARHSNAYR